MLGLFKRKQNPVRKENLEDLIGILNQQAQNFRRSAQGLQELQLKTALLQEYNRIHRELGYIGRITNKDPSKLRELKPRLLELKGQLEGLNKIYDSLNPKKEEQKTPLKPEGANFDPRNYFEINFKEEPKESLTAKKIEGELERMPTITTSTLESIVSEYQLQSRQKFIEKENGRIKKIKVDRTVYQGFLHLTEQLLDSYLNAEKGKSNTVKRRQFESLELQVNKVLDEGLFKLDSRLNPVYTGFETEEAEKKYFYDTGESFERQYRRLLYSSLENFEGKTPEEKRFSKAKALTELLGQYAAYNTGIVDRKELLEYSRRINSYIDKHVKDENKREKIKIKVKLEDDVISLYSRQKSSFVYRIQDNTDKIEFGTYKLKRNKYVFVKEGKTLRQKLNETIADMTMIPFYMTGATVKMTGKGIEYLGRGIKSIGNGIIYGAKKVSDVLSQPYGIKVEKLPRE